MKRVDRLKELANEVDGEGGYTVDGRLVSKIRNHLYCGRLKLHAQKLEGIARLTQVEEETTGDSHLDGLASLDLTSL